MQSGWIKYLVKVQIPGPQSLVPSSRSHKLYAITYLFFSKKKISIFIKKARTILLQKYLSYRKSSYIDRWSSTGKECVISPLTLDMDIKLCTHMTAYLEYFLVYMKAKGKHKNVRKRNSSHFHYINK